MNIKQTEEQQKEYINMGLQDLKGRQLKKHEETRKVEIVF